MFLAFPGEKSETAEGKSTPKTEPICSTGTPQKFWRVYMVSYGISASQTGLQKQSNGQ